MVGLPCLVSQCATLQVAEWTWPVFTRVKWWGLWFLQRQSGIFWIHSLTVRCPSLQLLADVQCNACTAPGIQNHVVYRAAMCRQLIWCLELVHLSGKPPSAAGRNKQFRANLRQVKWCAWDVDRRSVRLTFAELKKASANNSNDGYPVFYRCRSKQRKPLWKYLRQVCPSSTGPNLPARIPPPVLDVSKTIWRNLNILPHWSWRNKFLLLQTHNHCCIR
jgi:hypothetical protein